MVETLKSALSGRRWECMSGANSNGAGRKCPRSSALLLRRVSTDLPQVAEETAITPRKVYYPGFALLRIAAAIGVIQFHAHPRPGPWVDGFRTLMIQERVPTFMLMALFLTIGQQIEGVRPGSLGRRLRRLIVPLFAWTLIYDGGRFALHAAMGHWQKAFSLFLSPADQFLGGVWHLYFLTWLATGTVVASLLTGLTRHLSTRLLWPAWTAPAVAGILALVGSHSLEVFSAKVNLISRIFIDGGWLVEQCAKLLSGIVDYGLRALPYVGIALMMHAVRLTSFRLTARLFMHVGIGAMVFNIVIASWSAVCPHLTAWLGAASGLVFGLSIPHVTSFPAWVQSAARASYGIFLSHLLSLEFYELIWSRIFHQPQGQLDFVSFIAVIVLTFLTSWFVTVQLRRFTFTRRVFLGAD